jgi:hypothetical protein
VYIGSSPWGGLAVIGQSPDLHEGSFRLDPPEDRRLLEGWLSTDPCRENLRVM